MLTMIKAGVTALEAAGLLTRVLVAAGLVASLLAAYGLWHHKVFKQGEDSAIAGIAREDARFLNRGLAMRGTFKACRDQGRQWDQGTGKCL